MTMPDRRVPKHVPQLTSELTTHHTTECLVKTSNLENLTVKSLIDHDDLMAKVFAIKKVKNNFLEALYLLKKTEINIRHGQVSEQYMIHITGAAKINSIIQNNFDWRRVTRAKFGKGISFSKDATYANRVANWSAGCNRALIISRVIVSKIGQGFKDQLIPRNEFDTSVGSRGKVFVKFYDNEMLPIYVAFFREPNVDRVNRPKLNLPKQENLKPISNFEKKSCSAPNATPVSYKRPTKKPFSSQSNELESNCSGPCHTKSRPPLENAGQNRAPFEQKPLNNKSYVSGQNVNYPKINQRNVPSQNINFRPSCSANQHLQTMPSQMDWNEITPHIYQSNTQEHHGNVSSKNTNYRPSYSTNQHRQTIQTQIDWDEIYTPHIYQSNGPTQVQDRSFYRKVSKSKLKPADKSKKSSGFISCCKSVAEFVFCCCTRQA